MKKIRKLWFAPLSILLFMAGLSTANAYEFTQYLNIKHANSPSFSPDGKTLAFMTNVTGVYQGWTIPVTGGWPEQATFYEDGVDFFVYSPMEDKIAFGKDTGGDERTQLYLCSPRGENIVQLTNNPKVIYSFGGWSHDGKKIAYAANERDQAYFDVYVRDLAIDQAKLVYQSDANNSVAAWSPDDRYLVVARANTNLDFDLFLVEAATGTSTHLTPHTPPAVYESIEWTNDGKGFYLASDQDRDFVNLAYYDVAEKKLTFLDDGKSDVDGLKLSDDNRYLAIVRNIDGYGRLFLREHPLRVGTITQAKTSEVHLPDGIPSGLTFSKDGKMMAFAFVGPTQNGNIWTYEMAGEKLTEVTRSTLAGIPPSSFVAPTLVKFKSFDGLELSAFIYLPTGAKKDGSAPCIVMVHGGPESQERPYFATTYQYYLSRGYAILAPNIRGSTGYGKTYTHLDDIEKRGQAIQDVKACYNFLKNSGYVDPAKVAVMGASYGGYMTLAAVTFLPELWAAGVDIVGIANFETFLKNTGAWRRKLREAEYGYLDKDIEVLRKYSPIHAVDKIKCPLFVIQGANDPRVPQSEAEQIVDQVKKQGGAVEYMLFPDEGHGLAKLANRIKAYPAVAEFLDKHVKNRGVVQAGDSSGEKEK